VKSTAAPALAALHVESGLSASEAPMQQTIETTRESIRPYNVKSQYRSGLRARMREWAHGRARPQTDLKTVDDADPAARAFSEGFADADDDSDDPRGDDAACLAAYTRTIFAELGRIGATVSAWPDYKTGYVRLDDGLTDEAHEPESLLATLRGLPAGAGTCAMWEATTPIAVACLSWQSCCVVADRPRGEVE
jgi:hypothetical protein